MTAAPAVTAPATESAREPREVRVELLVGCKVYDADGECIGRVEEIRVEADGADHVVREFHVGKIAVAERLLGGGRMMQALVRYLSGHRLWSGYVVPWRDMDLSVAERPRVRRKKSELERLKS